MTKEERQEVQKETLKHFADRMVYITEYKWSSLMQKPATTIYDAAKEVFNELQQGM